MRVETTFQEGFARLVDGPVDVLVQQQPDRDWTMAAFERGENAPDTVIMVRLSPKDARQWFTGVAAVVNAAEGRYLRRQGHREKPEGEEGEPHG